MARQHELLVEQVGDETVVYDLESKAVHCLSPLAAVVFENCDGRMTPAGCATVATERLGRAVTEDEVVAALDQLEERSLFSSPVLKLENGNGMSRRDFARRSAVVGASALAVPLITSIAAPTAAMAASGIASGCAGCGKNPDCVSNHCCQSNAGKSCNQGCCVDHDNSCHFCNCNASNVCDCTVAAVDIPGGCPCICGSPGCVNVPCCPTQNLLCCTPTAAC